MSPFIKVFGFNRRTRKHPPANKPFSENPFVSLSEIFHDGWAGLGTLKHLFQLLNKGYAKFRRLIQNNKLERSYNQTPDLKLRYPFLRFLTYFFTTLCHGRYLLDSLQKLIRINRCYVHSVIYLQTAQGEQKNWRKHLTKHMSSCGLLFTL